MAVSEFQGDSDSLSAERQSRLQRFASTQQNGTSCVVSPTQICQDHSLWLLCQGQVCVDQPEIYTIHRVNNYSVAITTSLVQVCNLWVTSRHTN